MELMIVLCFWSVKAGGCKGAVIVVLDVTKAGDIICVKGVWKYFRED